MSKSDALNGALMELRSSSGDIEASAVVSEDGLIIASALPQGLEESKIAAMSAAMLSIGTRTAAELRRGKLQQLFVKGEDGYVVLMHAGPYAVLLAMTNKEAKLGLIFFDMARTASAVGDILT